MLDPRRLRDHRYRGVRQSAIGIRVRVPLPGFAVSALAVAAVALVAIIDRRHRPTDTMLALLAQEAR
jgi:hypothetical protein